MADNESPLRIPELKGPQKYHVFISHSSLDRDFAEELTTSLEKKAFKCFMYERDLPPDSTIVTGVCTNIRVQSSVILIVTRDFIEVAGASLRQWKQCTKGTKDRPATELIPAGNVAHGLAWSYFYGYLNLVLPEIKNRCEGFVSEKTDPPEMLRKMVIIIPSSCWCPQTLEELAPDMKHEGYIHFKASRAGNVNRDYKSSVYRVKDPDSQQEYLFIAEFATPVLSMYEMEFGGIAGLNQGDKNHERMVFSDRLETILAHPSNRKCLNRATLWEFEDDTEEKKQAFSKLLCQHIRRELKKEEEVQKQMDAMSDGYKEPLVSKLGDN